MEGGWCFCQNSAQIRSAQVLVLAMQTYSASGRLTHVLMRWKPTTDIGSDFAVSERIDRCGSEIRDEARPWLPAQAGWRVSPSQKLFDAQGTDAASRSHHNTI
jgi:hypothetical protein